MLLPILIQLGLKGAVWARLANQVILPIAHVRYIKIVICPPRLSGHFFHIWFCFLCAQVSSGNFETMESLNICNFDLKAMKSCQNFNISNVGYYSGSSLFAMELNNKKIEINCELQNHSFVSNRYVSQALQQPLQTRTECTLKNYSASKFSQTGLHRSSLLHVCSSLPLFICIFLCYTFRVVIFMIHSIWWQFPVIEFG